MPFDEIARGFAEVAQYLGVSSSPAVITLAVFMLLDKVASPAATRTLNAWIKREHYKQRDLKVAVVELFDHLYGSPLLTARTFFRSAAISLLSFGIYTWFARRALHLQDVTWTLSDLNLLAMFAIAVILSDFISLFLVRRCLTLANVNLTLSVVLALVGAAIAITGIISFFGFMLGFEPFLLVISKGSFNRAMENFLSAMDIQHYFE
jgi:antibiotic biosynthesis monooxygenase (ABM) superfamily enzyme